MGTNIKTSSDKKTKLFITFLLIIILSSINFAQTTVNFNLLTTDTDQSNPFNHTENSVTWTFILSGNTPNIHTWGDGTVNFQTGPNGILGSAKVSISRQDGADFNFKGIKLEATVQDQYIRVYGKNNGSTVYGPTAVDLVTGNLIQTYSPANWDGVDEIELIVYAATSGTGGYDNDMYLFIDDFQYTMNVVPSISNLNGDSGTFTEGDTPLTLDSGTGASVTDSDATGYNGGNVTVSITGATASEDISISTAGSVSLSAGMTAGSTVSVSGTSIGTIAAGNTGQDGSNLIVSLNSNATDARIGTLLQSITYTNDSQNPSGSRTVNFTVADGAGGTSTTSSITVTLSGVNDDPTLTGKPTDITVTEDVASNIDLSAVTFGDVDAGATSITFTIAAGAGTLSASSGGGVTIGGSGTATLTLSGTAANIDTYLNTASNIKYTSVSNANGSDVTTLTLSANDGGASGSGGGGNVSFGTVNVDITAVNDDPTITGLPTDITVTEETASNVDLSAATLSDVDAGSSSITLAIAAGAGTLSATSGGSVTIGGSGTGTMTLTGTVSNIDTYLNTASNIKYTGASNASGDNATTLTLTANDGGATGTGGGGYVTLGTVNVDITGINDDPTITGLPTDITVVEDVASNVDLSAATFADVDAGANSITLTIAAGAGTLSVAASAGLTFSGNATGTITITGTASNIDSYLNTPSNILYTSAANANGNDATTLTLTANDGGFTGTGGGNDVSLGTVNVDITAVNDPPVVSNVFGDNSSQVIAGSGAQNITDLDDATVANNDSPDYNAGFLTIAQISGTTNGNFGVDGITVTSGGDATITAGETIAVSGTSIGTVHATDDGQGGNNLQIDFNSANSTDTRIQSLIRSLTYSAASGLGARVFTLTLNDKDGTANGGDEDASGNFTITVTPNPPILGNIDGDNATIPVGGAKGNIDVGGNATVTDADSPNFNGGNLIIIQNTGTANGNFSVTGSGASGVASGTSLGTADQTITGSEIIYVDGVAIASVSASSDGQSGDNLVLNLGSNATSARTQQVIRALQYAAPSGLGNRTFTISLQDANVGGATGTANFTITITPPEIDLKQGTTAIADGGSFNYGNKALNSDNDITFTIHNTAAGVLSITTPITLAGADAGQFSIQQQPGVTVAANDSTTFIVRFKPTSAGAKTASISITNNDADENPYDITLNGSGNSLPTGGNDVITINEDATYTFSASDFTFNDPDTDTFAGIQLQSLETAGTLTYDGNDVVTLLDYSDVSKLRFTPSLNGSGSPYATFTFKVKDSNGGHSVATYTMTINVNAKPTVTINQSSGQSDPANSSTINFTVVFSESVTGFTTGDVTLSGTAGATTGTVIETAPNNGTTYNVAVTGMNASGTVIAIIAAGVASDANGANNQASTSTDNTVTFDASAPSGYSVTIDQTVINLENTNSVSFTLTNAEVGANYNYTFSDNSGGSDLTGSGTINNENQQISGIDLSFLADGIITLSVSLTDAIGNVGSPATDTRTKDTSPPTVIINSTVTEAKNNVPFRLEINFSEGVNGFEIGDIVVGNGIMSHFSSISSNLFLFDITPINTGMVTIDIPGGVAQDSAGNDNTSAIQLNIASSNNNPVLADIESLSLEYTENETAIQITSSIIITDIDDENIEGAVIRITGNYQSGEDVLSFADQNGITGSWDASTGIMSLSGSSSKANYETALYSVKYFNSSSNPNTLQRAVSFTINDGDENSNAVTRNINIISVNNVPVLAEIENSELIYTENEAAITLSGTITISDVDDENIEGAVIQITSNYQSGEDVLSFADQNGITGSWDASTGIMSLSGSATKTNYQTALRSVIYFNTSSNPNSSQRSVSFTISDGDAASNIGIRKVDVIPVNNPPTFLIQNIPLSFQEDNSITVPFRAIYNILEDADDDVQTLKIEFEYSGKNLTMTQPEDTLVIVTPKKDWYGKDTIMVKVSDASSTVNAFLVMNVNPVNDLPEFSDIPSIIKLIGDESITLNLFDKVRDVETPNELLDFEITAGNDSLLIDYSSTDGKLNISSQNNYKGITEVRIKVTDTDGGEVEKTVKVEVERNMTGMEELSGQIPDKYELYQNYPNPFNPSTIIRYSVPEESRVVIRIYNILGQEVNTLFKGIQSAGYHEQSFNGSRLASGIYIYTIVGESTVQNKKYSQVKKMLLVK